MMVPVRAKINPTRFLARARKRLDELASSGLTRESMVSNRVQLRALDDLHHGTKNMIPAGIALEHSLHPIQSFFILPLFALFNAGVAIDGGVLKTLVSPVGLGIVVGLFLGKQIGVTLFSWIAVRTGYADLPGITWPQIYGAGCLAGIGFTMSLFVAELAFKDAELLGQAKLGILAASLISGIVGYVVLQRSLPKTP
jgi:Na+:H+ antiporter, NhaA family